MNFFKKFPLALCILAVALASFVALSKAEVTDVTEYLDAGERTDIKASKWSTLFNLFVQKDGDSNIILGTAGNGLQIKEGTNARMGQATLVSGIKWVSNTSITSATRIFFSRHAVTSIAEMGHLYASMATGFGFSLNSSDNLDSSVIDWLLIEAP
jgi:hypothetical protein